MGGEGIAGEIDRTFSKDLINREFKEWGEGVGNPNI